MQLQQPSTDDVLALDWAVDGHFIATGDSHGRLTVYDTRILADASAHSAAATMPLHNFEPTDKPGKALLSVCWNPLRPARTPIASSCVPRVLVQL